MVSAEPPTHAHRLGAERLAEQAETELRATGARPRRVVLTGLDSPTASERRIAELASQGLTNREIAQALFVTHARLRVTSRVSSQSCSWIRENELHAALAASNGVAAILRS